MKGSGERENDRIQFSGKNNLSFDYLQNKILGSVSTEAEPSVGDIRHQKSAAPWSGIWPPVFSIFGNLNCNCKRGESKNCSGNSCGSRKKTPTGRNYYEGWRSAVRRVMVNGGPMRRILGFSRATPSTSRSDIWLLGVCYRVFQEGEDADSSNPAQSEGFASFVEDFSSRVLITYRKGFAAIGDTKYSSDVNWGCMLRSSQMLVAQAFLCHKLGRSWRKSLHKPLEPSYIEILSLFGDGNESPCSIHNLLQAGKTYGLAPGSWVGPYAMCRTWETLMRNNMEKTDNGALPSMMAVYVVSGDEDGERGGAPVLCIEDVLRRCSKFNGCQVDWSPVLLLVPLVLGLEKVNPRYVPLLGSTFTFPQSVGILGGRPGASTYIIGVQDEKAFYLDPHEVQQVVDIKGDDVDVDTSSYHCNVVRHIPLDSIDSSLAIGFYCRDKSDFDDFCSRAMELISESNGAPLFTVAETRISPRPNNYDSTSRNKSTETGDGDQVDLLAAGEIENGAHEDDWQLL